MAAEKEGGMKEAQLVQQRHEKAISELQVSLSHTVIMSAFGGIFVGYLGKGHHDWAVLIACLLWQCLDGGAA